MIDPSAPDYRNTPASPLRPEFAYRPAEPAAEPAVSIVTPCYNCGPLFHETARTVLGQSFQDWEWLIINDGSTDPETLALLDEYRRCDARIRVLDHPENRGLSAARNTGFREARAPFVVQLDGDDLLEPTAVEKWYWYLLTHPEAAFVKGYTVGFGAQEYLWAVGYEAGKAFLEENQVDATCMIRREVHAAVGGYDEDNRAGLEDWDFWLKCAHAGYWGATIPEYLDWYRRREDHSDRWQNWDYARGHSAFHARLRQRYPRLWQGPFPEARPRWHMPNETVPDDLPAPNRLQKTRPRLLLLVPWLTYGGADKFNLHLVELFRARGWEVTLAATNPGDHSWLPQFARHTPDIFVLERFLRLPDTPRFLRYLIQSRGADVVLVTNSEVSYLLLPYLRHHCPETVFLDYCHMEEEEWKNGGYPRMAVEYQELLDLNLVASNHLKTWMVKRGAEAERVRVCYINVDTHRWQPDPQARLEVRRRLDIPEYLPVILYAARLTAQKQPGVFARALQRLSREHPHFVALVAGDGPELRPLQAYLRLHRLEGRVRLLGALPNEQVRALMQAADIFFLPSRWEGIALTIYEAMACGLAVVGARVGGQAELVTPETGVLVDPGPEEAQAEQYARTLGELLADPVRRRTLGQAARRRVERHFPLERLGEQLEALIQEAAELHRSHPRPLPGPGLARACASAAVEYMRLFTLAENLWLERSRLRQAQPERPALRLRIYRALYRWHEPYYRWYSSLGWTWLDPLRAGIKKILLKSS